MSGWNCPIALIRGRRQNQKCNKTMSKCQKNFGKALQWFPSVPVVVLKIKEFLLQRVGGMKKLQEWRVVTPGAAIPGGQSTQVTSGRA